jgi:hypothetical protein
VIDVGKFVQFDVTAGLVQFTVFPPAVPETAKLPVQAVPVVDVEFHVNVPEKLLFVVAPETVPLAPLLPKALLDHVPETELPAWVRFITISVRKEPWIACVPWIVPDQFPATLADVGPIGVVVPPPHAKRDSARATRSKRFTNTCRGEQPNYASNR